VRISSARSNVSTRQPCRASETRTAGFPPSSNRRKEPRQIRIAQHAVGASGRPRGALRVVGSFVVSSPRATAPAENPEALIHHHHQ